MALEQKVETKIPNRLKIDRGFSFLPGREDVPGRPGKYGTGGPGTQRSSGHVFPPPGTGSDYIRLQSNADPVIASQYASVKRATEVSGGTERLEGHSQKLLVPFEQQYYRCHHVMQHE